MYAPAEKHEGEWIEQLTGGQLRLRCVPSESEQKRIAARLKHYRPVSLLRCASSNYSPGAAEDEKKGGKGEERLDGGEGQTPAEEAPKGRVLFAVCAGVAARPCVDKLKRPYFLAQLSDLSDVEAAVMIYTKDAAAAVVEGHLLALCDTELLPILRDAQPMTVLKDGDRSVSLFRRTFVVKHPGEQIFCLGRLKAYGTCSYVTESNAICGRAINTAVDDLCLFHRKKAAGLAAAAQDNARRRLSVDGVQLMFGGVAVRQRPQAEVTLDADGRMVLRPGKAPSPAADASADTTPASVAEEVRAVERTRKREFARLQRRSTEITENTDPHEVLGLKRPLEQQPAAADYESELRSCIEAVRELKTCKRGTESSDTAAERLVARLRGLKARPAGGAESVERELLALLAGLERPVPTSVSAAVFVVRRKLAGALPPAAKRAKL